MCIRDRYNVIQKASTDSYSQTVIFDADESLPLFRLDSGLIEQIIFNVLHNSLQYTPDNSVVTLTANCDQEICVIRISDNGNGVPVNELEHIFEKFYRIPHTKTGGTGLGLSIVKGFTEAHGGKASVKNLESGGAEFLIKIPAETNYIKNLKNE